MGGESCPQIPQTEIVDDQNTKSVSIEDQRKLSLSFERQGLAAIGACPSEIEEYWTSIPVATPDWASKAKVIRPKKPAVGRPLILYFHGGGFSTGTPNQVTRPAWDFARTYGAVVVCATYRRTPEYPWPACMRDGWEVACYLTSHAHEFGASVAGGLVVGGASAGASVAAVIWGLDLLARQDNAEDVIGRLSESRFAPGAMVTGCLCSIGLLVTKDNLPPEYSRLWISRLENAEAPELKTVDVDVIIAAMRCDDFMSPWFSGLNSVLLSRQIQRNGGRIQHAKMLLHACQLDPLRDDSVVLYRLLKDVGIRDRVRLVVSPDDVHSAFTVLPFLTKSTDPTVEEATMEGMAWLLEN